MYALKVEQRRRIDSPKALLAFTSDVVIDTLELRLQADIARTVLYGCQIMRGVIETASFADRLEAIEQRLGVGQGLKRWG